MSGFLAILLFFLTRSFADKLHCFAVVQNCNRDIASKKNALSKLDSDFHSEGMARGRLIRSETVQEIVKLSLETGSQPWLSGVLKMKDTSLGLTFEKLHELLHEQEANEKVAVEFHGSISDELLQYASEQTENACSSAQLTNRKRLTSAFDVPVTKAIKREISKLRVNGHASPFNTEEWSHALCCLRRMKCQADVQDQLQTLGFESAEVFAEDGTIRPAFGRMFLTRKKLAGLLDALPQDDYKKLREIMATTGDNRVAQARRLQLAAEIEALECSLVEAKVLLELIKKVSAEDLGKLSNLSQTVGRLKKNDSAKGSGRSSRHHDEFVKAFSSTVQLMPFLVMTTEQVNQLVSPDHAFGLTILDEASQSTCTALTILARSERLLVIGDDKQSSPSENQWSEEAVIGLKASLPDIPAAQQLSAGYGFFDFCRVAFPNHYAFLPDHFRCRPESIAWSNETSYHGRINTYKPPGRESALVSLRVMGTRKKKTNQVECDTIVQLVHDLIQTTVESRLHVQSIGIISMGGPDQCKLIKASLDKGLDSLRVQHGAKAVDRHNIEVGQPPRFQGCERDSIYLSGVYDERYVYAELDTQRKQYWNVAKTRSKGKVTLVHSYDIGHIKNKDDVKRDVFGRFLEAQIASASNERVNKEPQKLRRLVEKKLISSLQDRGYEYQRMDGNVWSKSLCIRRQGDDRDDCALICVEHHDESKEAWETWPKISDQQMGLERAGTPCLRVDFLSLALDFHLVLDDVLVFLKDAGLPELVDLVAAPKVARGESPFVSDFSDSSSASNSLPSDLQNLSGTGTIQASGLRKNLAVATAAGGRKRRATSSTQASKRRATKSTRLYIDDDSEEDE
jgi:AAA domain